jgi:stage IV sporulation protein FB
MPKISISLSAIILLPAVIFDPSGQLTSTVIAALLHEAGHIALICLTGAGVKHIRVTPYGLEIQTVRSYRDLTQELAVSLAGCAVNLAFFLFLLPYGGFCASLASSCAVLGVLNALPVTGLDGGEALKAFSSRYMGPERSERLCRKTSFCAVFLLLIRAMYSLFYFGESLSLFLTSAYLFLSAVWHRSK